MITATFKLTVEPGTATTQHMVTVEHANGPVVLRAYIEELSPEWREVIGALLAAHGQQSQSMAEQFVRRSR